MQEMEELSSQTSDHALRSVEGDRVDFKNTGPSWLNRLQRARTMSSPFEARSGDG
jgi:hypothetical protein